MPKVFALQMQDISDLYALVRDALVRSVSEAELESLDTSTSTEGEHTPTPSPGLPMTQEEFETSLQELIEAQKWSAAISHVRQFKRISQLTSSNPNLTIFSYNNLDSRLKFDEMTIILNAYAQNIMKDRAGKSWLKLIGRKHYATYLFFHIAEAFIVSKSDSELFEVYAILSENLYHVSSALTNMEINMKNYSTIHMSSSSTAVGATFRSDNDVTNL